MLIDIIQLTITSARSESQNVEVVLTDNVLTGSAFANIIPGVCLHTGDGCLAPLD